MSVQRRDLVSFRVAGFRIRIDPTWLILAVLIAVSLTYGVFPAMYEGMSTGAYFLMALAALFGLTFSIVLHELGHSLVARAAGLPIHDVTLFMFGGAAELEAEPEDAKTEFVMALAGPLVSLAIGGLLLGAWRLAGAPDAFGPWAVVRYLGLLNIVLAGFNLIPSFPLDGGRVLRAALWMGGGDRYQATRRAIQVSQVFTVILMGLGVLSALGGAVVAGLWWVLIALFIRGAVFGAWRDAQARQFLAARTVADFMVSDPVSADGDMSVQAFVDQRLYPHHHTLFPVMRDGVLVGAAGVEEVQQLDKAQWADTPLAEIARPIEKAMLARPGEDAASVLSRMSRVGAQTLLVADDERFVGLLAAKDMLDHLRMRTLLEG